MDVAVGKIGRSVLFDSSKWAATGGDNEPSALFEALAIHYPQHTFHMVGKSDMARCGRDLPPNLVDAWAGAPKDAGYEWPSTYARESGTHFSAAAIMSGPCGKFCVPDKFFCVRDKSAVSKPLQMAENYAAPIVNFLNETMVPYVLVSPDPRYIQLGRDSLNPPRRCLSQFDTVVRYKRCASLADQDDAHRIPTTIKVEYAGVEKMFLIGRKREIVPMTAKTTRFAVVCNEGSSSGGMARGLPLSRFVLSHMDDVKVYGKWSDEWMKDPRFVGPVKFEKLQEVLPSVKYTLAIPISAGWVTAKFWEMAHYGIVPFLHPLYDTQRHLDCHPLLRLKSPEEMYERMDAMDRDPALYVEVRESLDRMISDADYDGSAVSATVVRALEEVAV